MSSAPLLTWSLRAHFSDGIASEFFEGKSAVIAPMHYTCQGTRTLTGVAERRKEGCGREGRGREG